MTSTPVSLTDADFGTVAWHVRQCDQTLAAVRSGECDADAVKYVVWDVEANRCGDEADRLLAEVAALAKA